MKIDLTFLVTLFISALLFTSCQDDVPAIEYRQQGFIEGTITGTASDDETPISEKFRYTQYSPNWGYPLYYQAENGYIEIYFSRHDFNSGGYFEFGIYLEDENATTPDGSDFGLYYFKDGKEIAFFQTYDSESNEITFTNLSFDLATGRLQTDYAIEGSDNSSYNNAVVIGKIDVIVKKSIQ